MLLSMLTHRPEKELDLKSECILVSAMVQISQETFVHQQAWESGAKWENCLCLFVRLLFTCTGVSSLHEISGM